MAKDLKETDSESNKKNLPWWKRVFSILGKIAIVIIILFIAIVFFIRSPWGQNIIVGEATSFVENKTNTKFSIDKLYITFGGAIDLQGLYVEDLKGDTLLYSKKLQVDIPIWPILKGNPVAVDNLKWEGLRANVTQKDSTEAYNFQFLIDAFAPDSTTQKETKEKSTTSEKEALEISIGTINFSDFIVNYDDQVSGIQAELKLGELFLEGKEIDLEAMHFGISEISLKDTDVKYLQSKPMLESEDTTSSALPFLSLDELNLNNVTANYRSIPDGIFADLNISDFLLEVPKADLANQNIEVGEIALKNSALKLVLEKDSTINEPSETDRISDLSTTPFEWPQWNIEVSTIDFANNNIHYQVGANPESTVQFNPEFIVLHNFNLQTQEITLEKEEAAAIDFEHLSFTDTSKFNLKELTFQLDLAADNLVLNDFTVESNRSTLDLNASTQFSSISRFIEAPEKSNFTLDLSEYNLDLRDAYVFQPDLKENEYIEKAVAHPLIGELKVDGNTELLNLSSFIMTWGKQTEISANGEVQNVISPDKFYAEIKKLNIKSTNSDIYRFISQEELGVSIPNHIQLESQFSGALDQAKTTSQIKTSDGNIELKGAFKQQQEISFTTDLKVVELNLGKILMNPDIGMIAFDLKADGQGNDINDLNAQLESQFSQLEFNNYDFSALKFTGNMKNGDGQVNLNYKDDNLNIAMNANLELDSVQPKVDVILNLEGADLYALGFTEDDFKTKVNLQAMFKGNAENFELSSKISEGLAVVEDQTYHLGTVELNANSSKDSTDFKIESQFLNGEMRANAGIDKTRAAIERQLKSYFTDSTYIKDSIDSPVKLFVDMQLSQSEIITELMLPEIKAMDTLRFHVDFNEKNENLIAQLSLPYLDYDGNTIDSLQLDLDAKSNIADFIFGFDQLEADPISMNNTFIEGDIENNVLHMNLHAHKGEKESYYIGTRIQNKDEYLTIHLEPEKLIIQKENWQISPSNLLKIGKNKVLAENFSLSKNAERLKIANDLISTDKNNIGIEFSRFKLENFLSLLNEEEKLATGELNGNIVVIDPFESLGLSADLNIEQLEALEEALGEFKLKTESKTGTDYDLELSLNGEDIDFGVIGKLDTQSKSEALDFEVNLNRIGVKTIAGLSGELLSEANGYISGQLNLNGSMSDPDYNGEINFNDANFRVNEVNTKFILNNDRIDISKESISFKDFSIKDEQNNNFVIGGEILLENISDPTLDLSIETENFQPINSKKEDNDMYYGLANFDMKGTIKGKVSFPTVDMSIGINEKTNFTYVIQSSQASIEKREGIIEFVNKENPDNIITSTDDSTEVFDFGGIELNAKLKIDKGATFNVIVDPQTEDNLKISGEGEFDFKIARNGRTTLTGMYEINDGHYQLSLYNLVKREFKFEDGSSISWAGDPMDADLNVTAKYSVKTSAYALMASQTSGASDEVKNKYRQRLPFFVYLNVNGELSEPRLGFRMGMPEDSRGAIDGTVYSRIRQLNNQEDALNKQVFSLLVLNKFYPNAGSDGSSGGTASIVRDNINDALSDQLNSFSDKLMGNTGIELNFGLNSYTDYQGESAEQRTDLNVSAQKKLMDDRLIVEVGSTVNVQGDSNPGEENSVVGNASIQYLLTEDGRWRLKGFRSSEYENVIDGQVYVNGISIIFQRQFNKLKNIFGPAKKSEEVKENKKQENKKENQEESTSKKAKEEN